MPIARADARDRRQELGRRRKLKISPARAEAGDVATLAGDDEHGDGPDRRLRAQIHSRSFRDIADGHAEVNTTSRTEPSREQGDGVATVAGLGDEVTIVQEELGSGAQSRNRPRRPEECACPCFSTRSLARVGQESNAAVLLRRMELDPDPRVRLPRFAEDSRLGPVREPVTPLHDRRRAAKPGTANGGIARRGRRGVKRITEVTEGTPFRRRRGGGEGRGLFTFSSPLLGVLVSLGDPQLSSSALNSRLVFVRLGGSSQLGHRER